MPANISTDATTLLGPAFVNTYTSLNDMALTFGLTLLGVFVICFIAALVLKPFFYLFFTIKLGYQGLCEICKLARNIIRFTIKAARFIYKKVKGYRNAKDKEGTVPETEQASVENTDNE